MLIRSALREVVSYDARRYFCSALSGVIWDPLLHLSYLWWWWLWHLQCKLM